MNAVLKTSQLTKTYSSKQVVKELSMTIQQGDIYGFIGKNGAGKTTLIRMIAGLATPSSGSIELFGSSDLVKERAKIGTVIESPALFPNMTARENLITQCRIANVKDLRVVDETLELVGLSNTGKKKAKNFSLGMKQRLGIADALIGNPEFLILDEPVNGLDPLGVVEIRSLLTELCRDHHITILISSHNLPELYQIATDYIIIHKGKVLKTLSQEQLDENCKRHFRIQCQETAKLAAVLEESLGTTDYKVMPDGAVKLYDHLDQQELVAETLYKNGLAVTGFSLEGDSLENYFISVIGGGQND